MASRRLIFDFSWVFTYFWNGKHTCTCMLKTAVLLRHTCVCPRMRKWLCACVSLCAYLGLFYIERCKTFGLGHVLVPTGSHSGGGAVAVYVFDINHSSLPTPFYSVLSSVSVFMALSSVFHSINSPDNCPLSHSVLPVLFLPYWSFQLYISSIFMVDWA